MFTWSQSNSEINSFSFFIKWFDVDKMNTEVCYSTNSQMNVKETFDTWFQWTRNIYNLLIALVVDSEEERSIEEMLNLFIRTSKSIKIYTSFSNGMKSTFLLIAKFFVTSLIAKSFQLENSNLVVACIPQAAANNLPLNFWLESVVSNLVLKKIEHQEYRSEYQAFPKQEKVEELLKLTFWEY